MIDMIKNMILAIKTGFSLGKTIGQEGKNKDFVKNPIKTLKGVRISNAGEVKNNKDP